MEVEGGGGGGQPRLQDRLQDLLDGLRGELNLHNLIKMALILFLFVGMVVGVKTMRHKRHPHPPPVALWCKPNATVSLEGGQGVFSSISEAVVAAPSHSADRFCIHVRGGRYTENIVIPSDKTNLVLLGDGADKTVIAANRSCGGHYCELQLATLLVQGQGFTAVDLTVENNEDPVGLATAAVENWSDRSIFYRCTLRSRHEVVRAYTLRQFYRDCHVQGSGSLVYGGAQAFFQSCSVAIDGTVKNVVYVVAEQSSEEPNLDDGFVFHNCHISALDHPTSTPLLGAALTAYSRIAYLQCDISLQEAGWSNNGFEGGTTFFAEYGNTRPVSFHNSTSSSADVRDLDFSAASHLSLRSFFPEGWIPDDIPHGLDLGSS